MWEAGLMKTIIVEIETGFAGQDVSEEIELPDDATEADAEEVAKDCFFNQCNYGWRWKDGG